MSKPKPSKDKIKEESKRDRFHRLASMHVEKALKAIELIGNLSGPQYECSPDDVERITKALSASVSGVDEKLRCGKAKGPSFMFAM